MADPFAMLQNVPSPYTGNGVPPVFFSQGMPLYTQQGATVGGGAGAGVGAGGVAPESKMASAGPSGAQSGFAFPNFNVAGFPYQNYQQQLAAAFAPPNQQFSNGSQYGRWNGVNNNAFGLFPNQFGPLFGYQPPPNMQFQPPYGNNGNLGSNQGPGSNPGFAPTPTGDPKIAGGPSPAPSGYTPGMDANNFGQSPQFPGGAVPGGDQSFSLNRMPNGSDSTSAALQNLLASGRGGAFANAMGLNQGPQSISVNDFNRVNAVNPGLAFTLASMGGGNFRNAIQSQDNLSQPQMNSYLNSMGAGNNQSAFQGLNPQNLALLHSMGIG